MGSASKNGLMEPGTKACGRITKPVEREGFFMWMAIFSRVNGWRTELTVMGSTCMQMGPSMKGPGRMICSMDMGVRHGRIIASTSAILVEGKSRARDVMSGWMGVSMKANGMITKLVERASISGRMGGFTKVESKEYI
jgi:hypothetical protein